VDDEMRMRIFIFEMRYL